MLARGLLTVILPAACRWAEAKENEILRLGYPLKSAQLMDAQNVGVRYPERIRVALVDEIPFPISRMIRRVAGGMGIMSQRISGLTLRYGIYIRRDRSNDRPLLVHEFVHTRQYEEHGGFKPFLEKYLHECLTVGYPFGPMEQEARSAERCLNCRPE
jgi:hypothetical protein